MIKCECGSVRLFFYPLILVVVLAVSPRDNFNVCI
jgi:hypothetical protein